MHEPIQLNDARACLKQAGIDLILLPQESETENSRCCLVRFLDAQRLVYCLNDEFDFPAHLEAPLKKCAKVVLKIPNRASFDKIPGIFQAVVNVAQQCCLAMADGASQTNMKPGEQLEFAKVVMTGSALMAKHKSDAHFGALKDSVTAPGGMTIRGLHKLRSNGFQGAIMDLICAADICK